MYSPSCQDTLFFLKTYIMEVCGGEETRPPAPGAKPSPAPPPKMGVMRHPTSDPTPIDQQSLLMQFDELTQELQVSDLVCCTTYMVCCHNMNIPFF